jgi:TRAP-type C4-dicarboxylate transport system permease small subunit
LGAALRRPGVRVVKRWLKTGADALGAGLFTALFLVFIVQITARFGFNRPLPWTDELAVVLYVWVILWAAAFMVPAREHVMFDLVYHAVGPRTRRAMLVVGAVMIGVLAAWAIPGSWDYVHFMAREGTPVLGLPFMWVFLPFVALLVALVVRSAWQVWSLLRGAPLEESALTDGRSA